MTSPESFRQKFPIFQDKIFLNSCSKGALSREVETAYQDYLESWRRRGSPWDEWVATLESLRGRFAALAGCSPEELAVTYCASTAAGSLASALCFEGERKRILLEDFQFPTMAHNWLALAKRGAEIVRVRSENGRLPASAYEAGLDERVLLAPLAHICFRNGFRQDVERLVAAARDVGAWSFVDDYQSTGTRPLDLKRLGCDFLVTGALKYLLGSSGLAFLYVRKDLVDRLEPTLTGWFGQERPFDFDIERATYHASARRFETGTPPVPNLYAGLAGISLIEEVGLRAVGRHVEALATRLVGEAHARGWSVLTPEDPERRGPMAVLGCRDADAVVEALSRENIVVSARGQGLRVSFHYYNIVEDVDILLRVLDRHQELMAREGERR